MQLQCIGAIPPPHSPKDIQQTPSPAAAPNAHGSLKSSHTIRMVLWRLQKANLIPLSYPVFSTPEAPINEIPEEKYPGLLKIFMEFCKDKPEIIKTCFDIAHKEKNDYDANEKINEAIKRELEARAAISTPSNTQKADAATSETTPDSNENESAKQSPVPQQPLHAEHSDLASADSSSVPPVPIQPPAQPMEVKQSSPVPVSESLSPLEKLNHRIKQELREYIQARNVRKKESVAASEETLGELLYRFVQQYRGEVVKPIEDTARVIFCSSWEDVSLSAVQEFVWNSLITPLQEETLKDFLIKAKTNAIVQIATQPDNAMKESSMASQEPAASADHKQEVASVHPDLSTKNQQQQKRRVIPVSFSAGTMFETLDDILKHQIKEDRDKKVESRKLEKREKQVAFFERRMADFGWNYKTEVANIAHNDWQRFRASFKAKRTISLLDAVDSDCRSTPVLDDTNKNRGGLRS